MTEAQVSLLKDLSQGARIVFSRDGDCGWLAGKRNILPDGDIIALRKAGFLERCYGEYEEEEEWDEISGAGRAALLTKDGQTP